MTKNDLKNIWLQYERGVSYNSDIGLYDTVKKNENFYIGKQWEGVNAPAGLEKPVFNIMKRVVSYFISSIVSDDVTAQIDVFNSIATPETETFLRVVSDQIAEVIETAKVSTKNREAIRNCAVDNDTCFYVRYDNTVETGQLVKGAIDVEIIDNTNVLFGNPQVNDVQKQPYIIISMRKLVDSVRQEAKENGIDENDIELIKADDEENSLQEVKETDKVTVLVKLYKKNGTVHAIKCVKNLIIQQETDLEYRLYPIAYMSWEKVKNSYHGQGAISEMIPNQIFINKLFAMSMEHVRSMAFPKVVYNQKLLGVDENGRPKRWNNGVGVAIGVQGDPNLAVATGFKAPDMSNQVMALIEKVIQYTRDTMGASDASLGNVKPDNTSAIIAVQKSTAMPLELQRMDFYQFVEDYIRIFIDIMRVNYGMREVVHTDADGNKTITTVDFSLLNSMYVKLNVEIGATAYWSELMQVQTIDNLFAKGIIQDAVLYLESIPDGYIKNKQKIIDSLKQQKELLQEQMQSALPPAPADASGLDMGGLDINELQESLV